MVSGAAGSPEDAGHLCEALRAAGVVIRVGGTVYLRPDEVAEIVLKARFASRVGPFHILQRQPHVSVACRKPDLFQACIETGAGKVGEGRSKC